MNEINFEIQDIKRIDLSMDVGVKEIYPPIENLEVTPTKEKQIFTHENSYGYDEVVVAPIPDTQEDLTEELNTYNTELTKQETKIADVIELLQTKATPSVEKYAPRYLNFSGYTGTELNYELANLDTSNMTSLTNMFNSCRKLTSIVLENLNTSNVTSVNYLFNSCKSLTSVVLRNLDISNVTSLYGMFMSCSALNSVVFENTDTSKITDMSNMFYGCNTTTSLDLSTLDTSSVTNMYGMFNSCGSLQFLDIRKFDFSNVTKYDSMFLGVPSSCVIIVKDNTAKRWIQNKNPSLTVRTVAELEG